MAKAEVTTSNAVAGQRLRARGFFVAPVGGGFLGLVFGVYLAERIKLVPMRQPGRPPGTR